MFRRKVIRLTLPITRPMGAQTMRVLLRLLLLLDLSSQAAQATPVAKWPTVVVLKDVPEITVIKEDEEARQFIYQSPHYEFRSPARLGASVVREFARVFETTYLANAALPLDYTPAPEFGREKFLCTLFLTKADYLKAGGVPGSAAVYAASSSQILIPLESLGVKLFGKKYTLDHEADNATLIHEITHQMMNAWLGRLPIWFVEGSAEYIRTASYERGKMSFVNRQKNLQAYLQTQGSDGRTWEMVPLQKLMTMDLRTWSATMAESGKAARRNYASAALLVYYFYHLDGRGDAHHTANFLKSLLPRDQNLQAASRHLLRERAYAELQEDVAQALRKEGFKITWAAP